MNAIAQEIKHVVVLMFENRSFDDSLGRIRSDGDSGADDGAPAMMDPCGFGCSAP